MTTSKASNHFWTLVAGGLALLIVAWALFLRGGGPDVAPGAQVGGPERSAPGVETGRVGGAGSVRAAPPGSGPVETFEVFAPKDPFAPLVGSGDSGSDSGSSNDPGEEDSIGGHRVRLIDVYATKKSNRAQVQVDSTVYTVDVGEVFADNYKLLSASGECASLLYGDDQFTLCEGEEILK